MILLILLIIFTIAGWAFFAASINNGNDGLACLFVFLALMFTGGSIGGIVVWANQNCEARVFKADRDYYEELVLNLSEDMSFETVSRTISRAKSLNERIERDRRQCNNAFYGTFYNKKIAEFDLIDVPDLYFVQKNERDL